MNKSIIFDCDGVLVDSEILAHQCDIKTLSKTDIIYLDVTQILYFRILRSIHFFIHEIILWH